MEHFNARVSQEIQEKLKNLAESVKDDFIREQNSECYGEADINEISGNSFDGFIAFQDGGYEVSSLYRHDIDSSYHFTAAQSANADHVQQMVYDDFKREHKELNLPNNYCYDDIPEELQNEFSDMESEYFEPALLRFETWVDRDTEQSIFLRLSLNYRDQPYYRSKYDETLFEIEINPAQLLKKDVSFFLKLFNRKMRNVK